MRIGPATLRVTLHVATAGGFLLWSRGERWIELPLTFDSTLNPEQIVAAAIETLTKSLAEVYGTSRTSSMVKKSRWRLVLPWGFHNFVTEDRAFSSVPEFSDTSPYPFPIQDLVEATIPLSHSATLSAALSRTVLTEWVEACDTAGVICEGIWTPAAAMVEYLTEFDLLGRKSFEWCDGRLRVDVAAKEDDAENVSRKLEIINIRARAANEPACTSWDAKDFWVGESKTFAQLLPQWWPAGCVSALTKIDPSEGLSLAREEFRPPDLTQRRQRSLAWSLVAIAFAFILWGAAYRLQIRRNEEMAGQARMQVQQSYELVMGKQKNSATPIADMEQRLAAWQNLRQRTSMGFDETRTAQSLSSVMLQIPKNLPVTIQSMRCRANDVWLDGTVNSQSDARLLEDTLGNLPHVKADPMRTLSAEGGLVHFSVHLVL